MINDWQNMSGYRPRKKNPKTENHPKNKKQQAEEMHFYFSSYYKWIPEKRKQQQKNFYGWCCCGLDEKCSFALVVAAPQ